MAITNTFDIKLLNFLKFKSIFFCIFFATNTYSIELVCKGESLRDPSQRPVQINCANKGDVEEALLAAMKFIESKKGKSIEYNVCKSQYERVLLMDSKHFDGVLRVSGTKGISNYIVSCSSALRQFP